MQGASVQQHGREGWRRRGQEMKEVSGCADRDTGWPSGLILLYAVGLEFLI